MAALDTNVLVRYLVQDDAKQGAAASRFIHQAVASGHALFVPVTVMLELEWVLRSAFAFTKAEVMQAFYGLLGAHELSIESEAAVEAGLAQFERGVAGFADCLHAALAQRADELPLWTFDKAASKLDGAQLLA